MTTQPITAKKRFLSKAWMYILVALMAATTIVVVTWPEPSLRLETQAMSWTSLPEAKQTLLRRQAYILFPDSFSGANYERLGAWLAAQNITHPALPQFFDTSAVQDLVVNNEVYIDAPASMVSLFNDIEGVMEEMASMNSALLQQHWDADPSLDPDVRFGIWVYKVRETMPPEQFPLFLAIVLSGR